MIRKPKILVNCCIYLNLFICSCIWYLNVTISSKHLVKFQTSHLTNSKMAAEMFEKLTSLFTSNLSVKAEEEEEEEDEEVKLL